MGELMNVSPPHRNNPQCAFVIPAEVLWAHQRGRSILGAEQQIPHLLMQDGVQPDMAKQ